ncbi:MAG: hypothetical protein KatS3mg039_0011 [Candidatus Kapaibacterium sp.]|nr:MAG: hypothetical protein KatS3mg039_0011 [Candidatus Kapabacteria bacterium]
MRFRVLPLVVLLCVAVCCADNWAQPIEISGRILDARGNPLPVAHAELRHAGRLEPLVQVRAQPDGSFAIRASGEGLFLLRLAGIHHRAIEVPVLVGKDPVRERITVELPTLPFPEHRDSILVATERALPQSTTGHLLEFRQRDGVYILPDSVEPPLRYRLVIRGGERGVVTASVRDSLELAPDSYYTGIRTGRTIAFDPAELPRRNNRERIRCESPRWQEVADAYRALMTYQQAFADSSTAAMDRAMRSGGIGFEPGQVHAAIGADRWRDTVGARLAMVQSPLAEQLWLLVGLAVTAHRQGDEYQKRALQRIPPSSPLWALDPQLLFVALSARPEAERRQFLDELIETNPDTTARAVAAFTELVSATAAHDRQRARALYAALTKRCPTHPLARTAERYNPDRGIQIGAELPAFRIPGKRKGEYVTRENIVGEPTLIAIVLGDCQPCAERLAEFAQWRANVPHPPRLVIVSVGQPRNQLAEVLSTVPHTLATVPGADAPSLLPFEVEGFPTLILTDARGTITATTQELRNLRTDVERYLQDRP